MERTRSSNPNWLLQRQKLEFFVGRIETQEGSMRMKEGPEGEGGEAEG